MLWENAMHDLTVQKLSAPKMVNEKSDGAESICTDAWWWWCVAEKPCSRHTSIFNLLIESKSVFRRFN